MALSFYSNPASSHNCFHFTIVCGISSSAPDYNSIKNRQERFLTALAGPQGCSAGLKSIKNRQERFLTALAGPQGSSAGLQSIKNRQDSKN
jgi:hypothetical protein